MNRRKITIFLAVVVVCAIGVIIYFARSKQPSGTLDLNVKPVDSVIKIDGKKRGQGKIRLSSGDHTLLITRSGFADASLKFNIKTGQTLTENSGLQPINQEGYDWISKHPGDILQGEVVSPDRQNQIEQTAANYPLITYLPYHSGLYSIDYGRDSAGKITIKISASGPIGRQVAIARIRSWGFDPTDYNLVFIKFTNPFSVKTQSTGAN